MWWIHGEASWLEIIRGEVFRLSGKLVSFFCFCICLGKICLIIGYQLWWQVFLILLLFYLYTTPEQYLHSFVTNLQENWADMSKNRECKRKNIHIRRNCWMCIQNLNNMSNSSRKNTSFLLHQYISFLKVSWILYFSLLESTFFLMK